MFLITNKEDKTSSEFIWGNNITHKEDNPNQFFPLYNSIKLAVYINPFYAKEKEFSIWSAEGSGEFIDEGIRKKFSNVKTLEKKEFKIPSNEQRIILSILCSANIVQEPSYIEWCISYLKNEDRSKEKALEIKKEISCTEIQSERINCAFPTLSAVIQESPERFTANSIYRSYIDSIDLEERLNLEQLIEIIENVSPFEIAEAIQS